VLFVLGAKEGSRTPTSVTSQDPESCASTNSATFAKLRARRRFPFISLGSVGCQQYDFNPDGESE
jgi:hypothetical protein